MVCPYGFYKKEETFYPRLYCKVTDKYCMFSKRCLKEEKYIQIEGNMWKGCYDYMQNEKRDIPENSYFVESYRPNNKGKLYLYIDINGTITKVLSDFYEFNQNYIYLKEGIDGYELSMKPFAEKKKSYNRKTKTEI